MRPRPHRQRAHGGEPVACAVLGRPALALGASRAEWGWERSGLETFLIGMNNAALAFAVGFRVTKGHSLGT